MLQLRQSRALKVLRVYLRIGNLLLAEDSKYMENDFWEFSAELYHLVDNDITDSKGHSLLPHLNSCKKIYRTYFGDTGTHFEELLKEILKEKKY